MIRTRLSMERVPAAQEERAGAGLLNRLRLPPYLIAVSVVLLAGGLLHLYLGRGSTFYSDDWRFTFFYTTSVWEMLHPYNGHNYLLTRALWNAILRLFGMEYFWFRALGVAANVALAAAVATYARRRGGWVAPPTLAVYALLLGGAFHTIFWPVAALGLLSLAALPMALLLLERRTARHDLLVSALALVALGTGGFGLLLPVGLAVDLLWSRRWSQSFRVLSAPLLIFSLWYFVALPDPSAPAFDAGNILRLPIYVFRSYSSTAAAMVGQSAADGPFFAALLVALFVYLFYKNVKMDHGRVMTFLITALAFWVLAGLARGHLEEYGAPRYVAFTAIPIVLAIFEAQQGLEWTRLRTRVAAIAIPVVLMGCAALLLQAGMNTRYLSEIRLAQLAAMELSRPFVPSSYSPDGEGMDVVLAADYFYAIDKFGSPAPDAAEIPSMHAAARDAADAVMLETGALAFLAAEEPPVGCELRDWESGSELKMHKGKSYWLEAATPGAFGRLSVALWGEQGQSVSRPTSSMISIRVRPLPIDADWSLTGFDATDVSVCVSGDPDVG